MTTRFGIGYDAHRLIPGTRLILAGVDVPYDRGLAGHSDGDVVTHSIVDALLGAVALGDIGTYFKADDPSVPAGVSSLELLRRAVAMVRDLGWRVVNVDATIVAQHPELSEHITAMRTTIAGALTSPLNDVNVKATSEDGMGFTGIGDGIAAMAVAAVTDDPES